MASQTRRLLMCCAMLLTVACTRVVGGLSTPAHGAAPPGPVGGRHVGDILLDQSRMQAITGAAEHLTIIPSMDGARPVDIDELAAAVPQPCRFVFAESVTFGSDFAEFHKTTFQDPPEGALISEGAAAYRDIDTARRAFDSLVGTVGSCAGSSAGDQFVGDWKADAAALHMQPGGCARDYRVRSAVLLEVTFCGFPQSVSDNVMANIIANIP